MPKGQQHPRTNHENVSVGYTWSQAGTVLDAGLMWQAIQGISGGNRACYRKEAVGEPYEGKPHVRFEVAGDGNRDRVWVIEALPKETGSKQAAQPKFWAPSPDPTTRPGLSARVASALLHLLLALW